MGNIYNYRIITDKDELKEGLFGQVLLYVFEILPYLYSKSIYPEWDIKSFLYGIEPDYTIIPGVFDLVYTPSKTNIRSINLNTIRKNQISVLGGNWHYMHDLWHSYFKIPTRISLNARDIGDVSKSLGVHFRGNDKNKVLEDTNPITHDEFIIIIDDFLVNHPFIHSIFVATDEYEFVEKMKRYFKSHVIINIGQVHFHKNSNNVKNKADRALLDSLLLSMCRYMIMTSSALSGFAKVLNPNLECYRVSASKLFSDIPYFPVAYIPKLNSNNIECISIIDRLFKGDWLENVKANRKYGKEFCTKKRHYLPYSLRYALNSPLKILKYLLK